MKRNKLITATVLTAASFLSAAALAGCNTDNSENAPFYDTATVYAQAQDLGYKGTLEEFIELISGKDGKDGADGKDGENGKDGDKGADGVGVKSGRIDERGHLMLKLTDDSEIDCGEAVQLVHEHTFSEWFLIKENDCTTAGLELRTCTCGHTEGKVTPATGHCHLVWDKTETTHTLYCDDCKTEIESGAHEYVDGVCRCGMVEPFNLTIPVEYTEISQGFEFSKSPSEGAWKFHCGIDFNAPVGTDVVAALGGTVEEIVLNDNMNGTTITLAHENGIKTVYKYINIKEGLTVGDTVSNGDVIATVAEASGSEYKQGPHLHFEVINNGKLVDPAEFLELPE